jgi:hypothetical protein
MKPVLAILAALALCSCAILSTPDKIVSTPVGASLPVPITNKTIITDLQSAASNLDQAVAIGALPANDPAPKCIHDILQRAGIEALPGAAPQQSFEPKNDGLASLGSIAYIQVQQQKAMSGHIVPVSVDCKSLLGTFVIDGAIGLAKLAPIKLLLQ